MAKKNVNKFNPKNWNWTKVGAYTGTALIAGLGVGFTVDNSNDNTIAKIQSDLNAANAKAPIVNTVEVEKIVEVDNGNLDMVLEHIYNNDGEVTYLTEDLDDNQISQITERIVFINELKTSIVKAVRADFKDEVDKVRLDSVVDTTYVGDDLFDEDEIKRLNIDNDDDELAVTVDDWTDLEGSVHVTGSFRQDGTDFNFELDAVFEDGVYDELDNIVITEA